MPDFSTLAVDLAEGIASVRLNRPDQANAMNEPMWREIGEAFRWADATPEVRVVVLSGAGRNFCSGIDLGTFTSLQQDIHDDCPGRAAEKLRALILRFQDSLTCLERCRKPVLAAIHGACVGGGLDLVAAADLRYCTESAYFSIKEIDLGMVADVGSLQRLPKLVAAGLVHEWAFTGRRIKAAEAAACGLVNRTFESAEAMAAGVQELARQIAAKSPLSIRGIKEMLLYSRDHGVAEGLEHVANWNAAMLLSADLRIAMEAGLRREPPVFRD
jgi:enoyl-CoA hydratase/carnithine racemase